jgi:hypothetical protein
MTPVGRSVDRRARRARNVRRSIGRIVFTTSEMH